MNGAYLREETKSRGRLFSIDSRLIPDVQGYRIGSPPGIKLCTLDADREESRGEAARDSHVDRDLLDLLSLLVTAVHLVVAAHRGRCPQGDHCQYSRTRLYAKAREPTKICM